VESTNHGSGESDEPDVIDGPEMKVFEDDLRASYMGSFTFYKKLPRRSRAEIFEEYKEGASIDEFRNMIIDRFLEQ
jgi:hypothetical protein